MAMIVGASDCSTGMAKALYDSIKAEAATIGAVDGPALKALCYALANGLVPYVQANAQAVVPSDGSTYAAVSNQSLGAMPSSTAQGTKIESLEDAGYLGVNVPLGGSDLAIQ